MLDQRDIDEEECKEEREQISQMKSTEHSKFVICLLLIFYAIVLTIFLILLGSSRYFRYQLYELISENATADLQSYSFVFLLQFMLIICGFDVLIFDIMFGYLCKPFINFFILIFTVKILARYACFLFARYVCRDKIHEIMEPNLYYRVLETAAKTRPCEVLSLLQIIALPTIFKTYMIGIFDIGHIQFLFVNMIGNSIWTLFWMNVGAQSNGLKTYIEDGDTNEVISSGLQATFIICGLVTLFVLLKLTNNVYQKMEKEYKQQS